MLKSLVRTAGFVVYFFITLEMLFMVTPFALYYYSAYTPLLSAPAKLPATAWLPAFFLPHLSTEVVPSIGGIVFLLGLLGFLVGAVQVYYAKFRGRSVVKRGFYRRVRHPQYLFLAIAGLGLLIVWPRFILLVIYIHMLWFYYLLAHSEEERMQSRYGEAYLELVRNTPMFIPGEPGGRLGRLLFGWITGWRRKLAAIYGTSLVVAVGGAFALRQLSLHVTSHVELPRDKIAAISFFPINKPDLHELIRSAKDNSYIGDWLAGRHGWILVQAANRKASIVHTMIDAGMIRSQARSLPVTEKGIQLIFLERKDQDPGKGPFEASARWQPVFIAELDGRSLSRVIGLDESWFRGNPVMPIF